MYFITTKRMLEVCFFQHTPTFIIEPKLQTGACERKTDHNAPVVYQNTEFSVWKSATVKNRMKITHKWMEDPFTQYCEKPR